MGNVRSIVVTNGTVYLGATYRVTGTGAAFALDSRTGQLTSRSPNIDGFPMRYVLSLALGGDILYIGGTFNTANGADRRSLAAVNTTTGQTTEWNPDPWVPSLGDFPEISCVAPSARAVYVAGHFQRIGGAERFDLAALDPFSGSALAWDPRPSPRPLYPGSVIAVLADTVYLGGTFTSVGGQARAGLAAVDATTGIALPWNPNPMTPMNSNPVWALATSSNLLYVAGGYTNISGQPRNRIAALDTTSAAATAWNPDADGEVRALCITSNIVYVGGDFTRIGGAARRYLAALDRVTGQALPWNPNPDGPVKAIAELDGTVYVGGDFQTIGGQARLGFALFPPKGWSALSQPRWTNNAFAARLLGEEGGSYIVQSSTNMSVTDWQPVSTNTVVNAGFEFVDPAAGLVPHRFYRARTP